MDNPKQRAALGFIFITIFIDVLGLGIIIPVMPKLLQTFGHIDIGAASKYSGWLTTDYAVFQLVFASVLGNLSDRFGRRPVLLISLFGFGIDYIVMAFAPTIAWLFVGRTIAGISGASNSTAMAYIADISTEKNKATNFGLVGAASGLGLIIGIALGAFLGAIDIKLPFMTAGGLAFANGFYGLFVLPESLSVKHRRKFDWKRANPIAALWRVFVNNPSLTGIFSVITLVYIAQKAIEYMLSFFLYEKFNWTLRSVGTLGIVIGLVLVAIQGGLIRYTLKKFGQEKNIVAGLLFYALGLTLIAFASEGWMMYLFILPYCLGGISGPALQNMATNKVAANAQGELQGAIAILNSLSVIIGPLLFGFVFYYFTNKNQGPYFPGAPYILAAILMLISTYIAMKSFKKT